MFLGVLSNPSGLRVKDLHKYLEYVIAHGDEDSIIYASSKPVTMISCEPNAVLMKVRDKQ